MVNKILRTIIGLPFVTVFYVVIMSMLMPPMLMWILFNWVREGSVDVSKLDNGPTSPREFLSKIWSKDDR